MRDIKWETTQIKEMTKMILIYNVYKCADAIVFTTSGRSDKT